TTTDIPALIAAIDTLIDSIIAAVITNAAGVDIAADIIAIKAETAAIVNDTDVIDDVTSGLVKIATDVAATLVDTAVIGAAGAGLTAVPWNAAWDAEVESEVDDALGGGTGTALTAIPWNASWDAEVQSEVQDALDATVPDSIPADGTRPSITQAAYLVVQFLTERSVSGATLTVNKPDGTTALLTLTLSDATDPTSITRAT
ncbi:MAG: cytochrome P450, partial [Gemmatimonadaceae bacterium]|nr:cytochrome P450 [Gemmatimonadaceae bacterium]